METEEETEEETGVVIGLGQGAEVEESGVRTEEEVEGAPLRMPEAEAALATVSS